MPHEELDEYRIKALEERQSDLEGEIELMKRNVENRERNQLIAGITFLGGVVMALGGVVWNYRSNIFGGGQ